MYLWINKWPRRQRQEAAEISRFWNNFQKHHTWTNLQDNKRHTGVNKIKLPCQLLLRMRPRWGFLCFTQAVFSPLIPGYWEGYISLAGWMWWRGAEQRVRSHTAHFTPGITDLLWFHSQCSHTMWFFQVFFCFLRLPHKSAHCALLS